MKKLLALAMLLVLCTVLTGLLTGCKVSVANTMMTDDTPKVTVTSPDVPVISTEWTERQYTVSEQDETVLLTARYQIPVLTLTGSATLANDWFSSQAGLAALHNDVRRPDRSSVYFRSSRFGSYGAAQAEQNALVYVSQGQPLLVPA